MKILALLTALTMVTLSCGSSEEEVKADNLKSSVKLSVLGKNLYVKDELFQASCNQFYFDFVTTSDYKCKTAKANVDLDGKWEITFTDGTSSIEGIQHEDKEILTIEDKDYYCYVYSGSVFTSTGEEKFFGTHQLLVNSLATKPSDLKQADVYLISNSSNEVCDAMH